MFLMGILIYFLLFSAIDIIKFQRWTEATPSAIEREMCENEYANQIIENILESTLSCVCIPINNVRVTFL